MCNFLESPGGDNVYLALAVNLISCIAMDVMATNLGFSFMPFAITIMAGTFCSFISLVSYQTNLMVFRPGE